MSAGFHYRTSIFLDQLYLWMVCFLKCWVDSSLGNTETAQLCYLLSPSELQCRQPIPDRLWQDTNFCFLEVRSYVGQAGLELIWSSYVSKDDLGLFFYLGPLSQELGLWSTNAASHLFFPWWFVFDRAIVKLLFMKLLLTHVTCEPCSGGRTMLTDLSVVAGAYAHQHFAKVWVPCVSPLFHKWRHGILGGLLPCLHSNT